MVSVRGAVSIHQLALFIQQILDFALNHNRWPKPCAMRES